MTPSRRQMLGQLLGAGAYLGLRSLASGIPIAVLTDPRRAIAAAAQTTYTPQYLVLSTSGFGDPMNANVPGTYMDANIMHPQQAEMAATSLTLNGQSFKAAAPWATLPQSVLDRTVFFHHATNTVVHTDEPNVMKLLGSVSNNDSLLGTLATSLNTQLGTIQAAPISLGAAVAGEAVTYQGRPQANLPPSAVATVLGDPDGPVKNLQAMRDQDLNTLNQWFKANGNIEQRAYLDRFATSQTQVRKISDNLLSSLNAISDNSIASQLAVATILIQMQLAPIFSVHMPFGGDNHTDIGLQGEADAHVASIAALNQFFTGLQTAGIADQVTFATLNVFGRTLNIGQNYHGRSHQMNHHCALLIGKNVSGGVISGVTPANGDYSSLPIDPTTGEGGKGNSISLEASLPAFGKTLGAAVGIPQATLNAEINGGAVVTAALV